MRRQFIFFFVDKIGKEFVNGLCTGGFRNWLWVWMTASTVIAARQGPYVDSGAGSLRNRTVILTFGVLKLLFL